MKWTLSAISIKQLDGNNKDRQIKRNAEKRIIKYANEREERETEREREKGGKVMTTSAIFSEPSDDSRGGERY